MRKRWKRWGGVPGGHVHEFFGILGGTDFCPGHEIVKLQRVWNIFTAVLDSLEGFWEGGSAKNGANPGVKMGCSLCTWDFEPISPLLEGAFLGGQPGLEGGAAGS